MGGQACVFYGAAQFSKDIDLVLFADEGNFSKLRTALKDLQAVRIAIPRFSGGVLARGHAVHFRCQASGVQGVRVDVMTMLRDVPGFPILWERRTTLVLEDGASLDLMALEDLVQAKKTQRSKDWPMISALVENHYKSLSSEPTRARIHFWLQECRTSELLQDLVERFPDETQAMLPLRPLLAHAVRGEMGVLRTALDAEARVEQDKDRAYWAPLKREMEEFRRQERESGGQGEEFPW